MAKPKAKKAPAKKAAVVKKAAKPVKKPVNRLERTTRTPRNPIRHVAASKTEVADPPKKPEVADSPEKPDVADSPKKPVQKLSRTMKIDTNPSMAPWKTEHADSNPSKKTQKLASDAEDSAALKFQAGTSKKPTKKESGKPKKGKKKKSEEEEDEDDEDGDDDEEEDSAPVPAGDDDKIVKVLIFTFLFVLKF